MSLQTLFSLPVLVAGLAMIAAGFLAIRVGRRIKSDLAGSLLTLMGMFVALVGFVPYIAGLFVFLYVLVAIT